MLRFKKPNSPDLLNFDWQGVLEQLRNSDPKEECFYMIVLNKGQEDEHRTRFMSYQEVLELVMFALEKKGLRISSTL